MLSHQLGLDPGVYFLKLSSPISNGTSVPFIVYSSTGLNATVDTLMPLYTNSNITVTWTPFAGPHYNTTITLISDAFPSFVFPPQIVPDTGVATTNVTEFNHLTFGEYYLVVSNVLGTGTMDNFILQYFGNLAITLNATSMPVGGNLMVRWSPHDSDTFANISLLRLQ